MAEIHKSIEKIEHYDSEISSAPPPNSDSYLNTSYLSRNMIPYMLAPSRCRLWNDLMSKVPAIARRS